MKKWETASETICSLKPDVNKEFKSLSAQAAVAEAVYSAEQGPQAETGCEIPRFRAFLRHRETSYICCSVAYHFSSCPCAQEKKTCAKKTTNLLRL